MYNNVDGMAKSPPQLLRVTTKGNTMDRETTIIQNNIPHLPITICLTETLAAVPWYLILKK